MAVISSESRGVYSLMTGQELAEPQGHTLGSIPGTDVKLKNGKTVFWFFILFFGLRSLSCTLKSVSVLAGMQVL